jgi:hypothetical protein
VLRARVMAREQQGTDASEAGLAVLDHQMRTAEALTLDEAASRVSFDTERMNPDAIRAQAQQLLASAPD